LAGARSDVIVRISEGAKTRDITGGLPRVAELFEARKPKDQPSSRTMAGIDRFGKRHKNKRRVIVTAEGRARLSDRYLIPKWQAHRCPGR
jgi:DNA-directed RNA polymerase subunit beta'